MLWCPLLCGLGAISFTRIFPSFVRKSSTAKIPTIFNFSATFTAIWSAKANISGDKIDGEIKSRYIRYLHKLFIEDVISDSRVTNDEDQSSSHDPIDGCNQQEPETKKEESIDD